MNYFLYIGNISQSEPRGIYVARYDSATAQLSAPQLAGPALDPNFLALHPNGKFLYAVTAAKLDDYSGAVEAFAIDPRTGQLQLLNRQPSGGENPAHLALDPSAQFLVVANYDGATVASFPLLPDGRLASCASLIHHQGSSVNPKRQSKPFPHGVAFAPKAAVVFITDLGADRIFTYTFDPTRATLEPADGGANDARLAPGSGPRHLAFAPHAPFAYVINELTSTLTVFAHTGPTTLREIQTVAPWPNKNPINNTGAEIAIHPNGRFLYASNRGYDSMALCSIDAATGKLALLAEQSTLGQVPRHFALDPAHSFLLAANLRSNTIVPFHSHTATGILTPTNQATAASAPLCLLFAPA